MIMFLDTETTGFPSSRNPKETEKFNKARLIELGYLIYDKDNKQIDQYSSLVKPDNFIITNERIHGITQNDASKNGDQLVSVMERFYNDLQKIDTIVCHNINFDMNILLSEAYRINNIELFQLIESKNKLCTMDLGKQFMKIKKFPKLVELYKFLYNQDIEQDHRSISDCIICANCYYKMI